MALRHNENAGKLSENLEVSLKMLENSLKFDYLKTLWPHIMSSLEIINPLLVTDGQKYLIIVDLNNSQHARVIFL